MKRVTSAYYPVTSQPNIVKNLLQYAAQHLKNETATLEAQLLLEHVLKVNRAWLITHADDTLRPDQQEAFAQLLARRLADEPIAYILGRREFFGLNLAVSTATLIPRADTETLVEAVLDHTTLAQTLTILDLGTGSGAIALAIAKHRPNCIITAVDFSQGALILAQQNAKDLNISNVRFLHSNWFSALSGQKFDYIVSNPPYIAEGDPHLTQGDVRFEPNSALVSGKDGLNAIHLLIKQAPKHLNPNGQLMLEHGYSQAQTVANLMQRQGFENIAHRHDLAGVTRVTLGQL